MAYIRGLTTCALFEKRFRVTEKLKKQLGDIKTREEAAALILEWGETDGIRYELAYDLQEELAEATDQRQCTTCHWVIQSGKNCCGSVDMDFVEPIDDYPDDHTREDWDKAFGSLLDNPDDNHQEIDSEEFVLTKI